MHRDTDNRKVSALKRLNRRFTTLLIGLSLAIVPLEAQEGFDSPIAERIDQLGQQAAPVGALSIATLERKILQALTPHQTAAFLGGADPASILLPTGESLIEFIQRIERSAAAGLVYKPVEPCLLVDSRHVGTKLTNNEARSLRVHGEGVDYSKRGGSASGCGIPGLRGEGLRTNTARALFLQVEVFDAEGPGELMIWPAGGVAAPQAGMLAYSDSPFATASRSTVAVAMCDEESVTPCETGDLHLKARGAGAHVAITVLGYFESASKGQSTFEGGISIAALGDPNDILFVGSNASFSFVNSWDLSSGTARDLYLNGSVGIKTTTPLADLHVTGGTGSVELLLEADTDDAGSESDQPKITLSQDGGLSTGQLGYFDATNHLKLINNKGGASILLRSNGDICIGLSC